MFLSAHYIDVKLRQDYADFAIHDNNKVLVICDGIGDFKDSGVVSKAVVDRFINKGYKTLVEVVGDNQLKELGESRLIGGTTFISAIHPNNQDKVHLEYLGNGGVIHLHGDFANNTNSDEPYRYGDIMIPHISPNGALTKHISHNSKKNELAASRITLNLNYYNGDILIFFSDGISSLEDKIILKDGQGRYWRNENAAIQHILKQLDKFLIKNAPISDFQERLAKFNIEILKELKKSQYLEDDASLGFIITENVLKYYQADHRD
jgi:hypothetical protein